MEGQRCLKFSENSKPSKCFDNGDQVFYFLNCQNILNGVNILNSPPFLKIQKTGYNNKTACPLSLTVKVS